MSDGFVIVTGKRGSKWNRTPRLRPNMKMQQTLEDIDEDPTTSEINSIIGQLKGDVVMLTKSKFFESVIEMVNQQLDLSKVKDIFCLGLGSFSKSANARHQLAFLLCLLRKRLTMFSGAEPAKPAFPFASQELNVKLADPMFTKLDFAVAAQLGFAASKTIRDVRSAECVSGTSCESLTLYHMPHCSRELYNQVLCANWFPHCLQSFAIIGNSFDEYLIRNNSPKDDLVSRVFPFITETRFPTISKDEEDAIRFDAFNDTAVLRCTSYPSQGFQKKDAKQKKKKNVNRLVMAEEDNAKWFGEAFWEIPQELFQPMC